MKKISIKGVVIGSVTDIVATNIVTIPLVVYVMTTSNLSTLPKDQLSNALVHTLQSDPALLSIQFFLGALCSVLGGFVAAWIAKRNEVLNGGLACFLCVGSGIYGLLFGSVTVPLWQHIVGFVTSPGLSALGGYLKMRTKRSQTNV